MPNFPQQRAARCQADPDCVFLPSRLSGQLAAAMKHNLYPVAAHEKKLSRPLLPSASQSERPCHASRAGRERAACE